MVGSLFFIFRRIPAREEGGASLGVRACSCRSAGTSPPGPGEPTTFRLGFEDRRSTARPASCPPSRRCSCGGRSLETAPGAGAHAGSRCHCFRREAQGVGSG